MEPHGVLGLPSDASEERIRAAFKSLALKWHPDRHPASRRDEATAKFVEINNANRAMLRNLRRARRSVPSSKASNASTSSPPSPEATSTSLPDECASSRPPSETSRTSPRSHTSTTPTPSGSTMSSSASCTSAEDKLPTTSSSRCSSPDSGFTKDRTTVDSPATSTATSTPKPTRSGVRKQSRNTNHKPDPIAEDYTPKTLHCHKGSSHVSLGPERVEETLHPVRSILRGTGTDAPKRWVHMLNMTLEELYSGKKFYFRVVRYRRSGRKTIVPLELFVPPGTLAGTEIVVEGIGNERKDGTMQAIVFLVKELKHEKFRRQQDDLLMEVRLSWVDSLNEESGKVYFHSIDAKEYMFTVNYHEDCLLSGTAIIPDAGMPSCDGLGRGRVVIRWAISSPMSSWGTLKQVLKFKG